MEDCIFCKIVKGQIPSKKIYENDFTIAFLDINPANKGHVLVAPKKHSETLIDTEEIVLKEIIASVREISIRLKTRLEVENINIIQNNGKLAGQIVSHIHFHIIPRTQGDKVIITYERQKLDENMLNEVQKILSDDKSENQPNKTKTNLDFEL